MRKADVNQLRAKIARLRRKGLGATAIAAELGCTRSAVYRALRSGGSDRRAEGGRRHSSEARTAALGVAVGRSLAETVGALDRMVAAGELAGPAPTKATVARWLKEAWERRPAASAPGEDGSGVDPYADLALDEDGVVAAADDGAAQGEVRLVRALLRDAIKELKEFERGTPERFRARAQAGGLLDVLTRVRRAQKLGATLSPALLRFADVMDQVGDETLGPAASDRGPAATALGVAEPSGERT